MFLLSTVGSMVEKQQKGLPWVQECPALLLCLACQSGQVDPVWGEKRDYVKAHGQKYISATQDGKGKQKLHCPRDGFQTHHSSGGVNAMAGLMSWGRTARPHHTQRYPNPDSPHCWNSLRE